MMKCATIACCLLGLLSTASAFSSTGLQSKHITCPTTQSFSSPFQTSSVCNNVNDIRSSSRLYMSEAASVPPQKKGFMEKVRICMNLENTFVHPLNNDPFHITHFNIMLINIISMLLSGPKNECSWNQKFHHQMNAKSSSLWEQCSFSSFSTTRFCVIRRMFWWWQLKVRVRRLFPSLRPMSICRYVELMAYFSMIWNLHLSSWSIWHF